ncbi:MAG: fumarylacetoacetate hydrolase family protein [Cytophagales bacterium]|nr:fumarylacetoacetate hydrolase family protein [Bernardetiaceae bacterium]MDW8211798.1 fumarylacetoacetate hydrolase family protein [Cytophagales bacterium]
MKLFRYGPVGAEKCGVAIGEKLYSVANFFSHYDENFFENDGLNRLRQIVEQNADQLPLLEPDENFRFGPPINRPSKIICIGLNYAQHAAESGMAVPKEPVIFFKATTALCGPNDEVIIPRNSQKTDWEVELAVIIGKKASYVEEEEAMQYVAGYAVHNDYSEREFQLERAGQWVKGKSCDTFAPLGPFLVTPDEVPDPHNLHLWLSVNGQMLQNSNTSDMIFKVPFLISYISQFMTLLAGDVISTGTPFGVGFGFNPPRYLKAGDIVELGIEGLGKQRQVAVNWTAKN